MPYSTLAQFESYHPAAQGQGRASDILALAADLVAKWAPAPDPVPADYPPKAGRAERFVAAYLFDTGGYISNDSLSGVSSTGYQADAKMVKSLIAQAMGDYYTGGGAYTLTVQSSFPPATA